MRVGSVSVHLEAGGISMCHNDSDGVKGIVDGLITYLMHARTSRRGSCHDNLGGVDDSLTHTSLTHPSPEHRRYFHFGKCG